MALVFGGATSNRVVCSYVPTNATRVTAILLYPTTFTSGRTIVAQWRSQFYAGWRIGLSGTSGAVEAQRFRGSSATSYISPAILELDKWNILVLNTTATLNDYHHLSHGILGGAISDVAWDTTAQGNGTVADNTIRSFTIGNVDFGTPTTSFQGRIDRVGHIEDTGALGADRRAQIGHALIGGYNVGWNFLVHLGDNGTGTQVDLTGNGRNGTVTGATLADGPPIARWRRGRVGMPMGRSGVARRRSISGGVSYGRNGQY